MISTSGNTSNRISTSNASKTSNTRNNLHTDNISNSNNQNAIAIRTREIATTMMTSTELPRTPSLGLDLFISRSHCWGGSIPLGEGESQQSTRLARDKKEHMDETENGPC